MPLEYSEFLIFLLCIVLVAVIIFAFTMGTLIRGSFTRSKRKEQKEEKHKPEPKPEPKPQSKPVPPNPCFYADQGGYVGILRKEWKKDREYPHKCYQPTDKNPNGCPHLFECIGVKK